MNSNHLHSPFAVQWSVWETTGLMTTKEEERQHRAEMREETSAARQRDTGIGTRPAVGAPHPAWQPGYCGEDFIIM